MSLILFLGCVLFIGEQQHLALDKTDIDALVDARLKQSKDWELIKMTATVTTEDHLKQVVTALKAATLETPIIAVVYVSGTNTSIQLLGQMIKKIRECIVPKSCTRYQTTRRSHRNFRRKKPSRPFSSVRRIVARGTYTVFRSG